MPNIEVEGFSDTQIDALWKLYVPTAREEKNQITEEEFKFFLDRCTATGLDPFAKQIGIVKRGGKVSIDYNIDGLRLNAERTGLFAGTTASFWCGEDSVWKEIWLKKWGQPVAAKFGVYKKGCSEPFWGIAMWDEFAQMYYGKPADLWAKMPCHMLTKCAEAMALRRAFPIGSTGAEEVQIDTSRDLAIAAGYRHLALPQAQIPALQENQEQRFLNLSQITGCPMPTIRALSSNEIKVSIPSLTAEQAAKLRTLVLLQWAMTIHRMDKPEAVSLFKEFWKDSRRTQSDESLFADWKGFIEDNQVVDVMPEEVKV